MTAFRRLLLVLAFLALVLAFRSPAPGTAQGNGTSLRFFGNGVNDIDRVKIPLTASSPVNVGGDFTLEFWMKANPGANGSGGCSQGGDAWINGNVMFDRDVFGGGDFGDYGVSLYGGRIAFGVAVGGNGQTLCSSSNLADGNWHHVAVTRRSTGEMQIFVDGTRQAQGTGPGGNISYRVNRPSDYPNSDPFLVIGAEKHDYPGSLHYNGWIDEVRLSRVVRYTGNFTRPGGPFSSDGDTVALYTLNEGNGTSLGDSSGASGGPSNGVIRVGGNPSGPVWSTDTPFGPQPPATATNTVPPGSTATNTPPPGSTATNTPPPGSTATPRPGSTATPRPPRPCQGICIYLPLVRR
ncbi:MAG: LamG domain-containing protein [Chloroflexaceae bacterium]|jgi:hypothetical protein|nr:LamG domain-containing protein [Chloroflexaceae bacterium]